jgi:hypothetical protein
MSVLAHSEPEKSQLESSVKLYACFLVHMQQGRRFGVDLKRHDILRHLT